MSYRETVITTNRQRELAGLEARVRAGAESFLDLADALREIRDRKLHRLLGYTRFDHYCRDRWGFSRSLVYEAMDFKMVKEVIPDATRVQARELAPHVRRGSLEFSRAIAKQPSATGIVEEIRKETTRQERGDKRRHNGVSTRTLNGQAARRDLERRQQNAECERVWVMVAIQGRAAPLIQAFTADEEGEEQAFAARDREMAKGRAWLHLCEIQ